MSRVAKAPVTVPNGVTVTQNGRQVEVKGTKGTLSFNLHALVELKQEEGNLHLAPVKRVERRLDASWYSSRCS